MPSPLETILRDFDEVLDLFVDQERDGAVIVACADMASGLVHAAIDGFDQRSPADLGLAFSARVDRIDDYVATFVDEVRLALEEADTIADADADESSDDADDSDDIAPHRDEPALFADAEDPEITPAGRLTALFRLLLQRLSSADGRLLIGLTPARIDDHEGYRACIDELLDTPLPGLRLIVRDERPASHISAERASTIATDPSVHHFDLPVDFDLLVASTRADADDDSTPTVQRLAALIQIGLHDLMPRPDAADRHFCRILAEVSQADTSGPGERAFLPLALYGRSEIKLQRGDDPAAIELLTAAWQTADESTPASIKTSIALSLGRALVRREQLDDARVFLAIACANAERCGSAEVTATTLIELGDLEAALGDDETARDAWLCARQLLSSPTSSSPTQQEQAAQLDRRLREAPQR